MQESKYAAGAMCVLQGEKEQIWEHHSTRMYKVLACTLVCWQEVYVHPDKVLHQQLGTGL